MVRLAKFRPAIAHLRVQNQRRSRVFTVLDVLAMKHMLVVHVVMVVESLPVVYVGYVGGPKMMCVMFMTR